jgi:hypothetical protein
MAPLDGVGYNTIPAPGSRSGAPQGTRPTCGKDAVNHRTTGNGERPRGDREQLRHHFILCEHLRERAEDVGVLRVERRVGYPIGKDHAQSWCAVLDPSSNIVERCADSGNVHAQRRGPEVETAAINVKDADHC